jgi:hypothetical protein
MQARERPAAMPVGPSWEDAAVTIGRIAWTVTVLVCLIACLALLLSGYQGYAAVVLVVGLSAAINLL